MTRLPAYLIGDGVAVVVGDGQSAEPFLERPWRFLTNHAQLLICIAADPGKRVRDIAACAGITERAAHTVLADLEDGGYITRRRVGRRNTYTITPDLPLANGSASTTTDLIALFSPHTHLAPRWHTGRQGPGSPSAG